MVASDRSRVRGFIGGKCRVSKRLAALIPDCKVSREPMSVTSKLIAAMSNLSRTPPTSGAGGGQIGVVIDKESKGGFVGLP